MTCICYVTVEDGKFYINSVHTIVGWYNYLKGIGMGQINIILTCNPVTSSNTIIKPITPKNALLSRAQQSNITVINTLGLARF